MGGLRARHEPAYLGSWAQCLGPVLARLPRAAGAALRTALQEGTAGHPIGALLHAATATLQAEGVPDSALPDWAARADQPQRRLQVTL